MRLLNRLRIKILDWLQGDFSDIERAMTLSVECDWAKRAWLVMALNHARPELQRHFDQADFDHMLNRNWKVAPFNRATMNRRVQ